MTGSQPSRLEQLKSARDAGLIDQDTYEAAVAAMSARLAGSGAVAQGREAFAVGAGGVGVLGDNTGTVNLGVLIQQGTRPGASKQDLTRAYLARILRKSDQLPLFVGEGGSAQVQLSAVYTALLTQKSGANTVVEPSKRRRRSSEDGGKRLSALDVLNAEPRLVLLGGPGSGKSTFSSFIALSMAGELLGVPGLNLETLTAPLPKEDGDPGDPQSQHWEHGALLPVPVVLRELASQLPPPGTPVNAETLWQFIHRRLEQAALGEFAPHLKQTLLERGGLVLLDGLDEVPDADQRRAQINYAVQDFAATFSRCRFLVTSRTYAYQRQDWKLDDFSEVHLLPFTRGQIWSFVEAWYAHMVALDRLTEASARDRAGVLVRTVERNERIRELAERPLLLTLIAQLQTEGGGTLPEKREELYDKAVDLLLTRWETLKVRVRDDGTKEIEPSLAEWLNASRDDIRRQLNRLAFEAHRDQPQLTGTAEIRQETLIAALLKASTRRDDLNVGLLERYLRDRAGILAAHGEGVYQFPHRSFQEYLAACHLTDDEFPDKLAEIARGDPNRWREVTLLAGAKSARGSSLNPWALAETLCPTPPHEPPHPEPDQWANLHAGRVLGRYLRYPGLAPTDQWGGLLAGRVLVECVSVSKVATRDEVKRDRIRDWQVRLIRSAELPASERALAGRSLAVLGDPRPEVMTLDGMEFALVPPGPFTMGDKRGFDQEKPQHSVDLNYPYFIGRYPVTVAQWRALSRRTGEESEKDEPSRGRDNDPVRFISWHDALRFCALSNEAYGPALPRNFTFTLPSEAEWEKAARGGEHIPVARTRITVNRMVDAFEGLPGLMLGTQQIRYRAYPWDGPSFYTDQANLESSIAEPSAVGCYPEGASPYGCEEMSGNVWEWTRSLWGRYWKKPEFTYEYDPQDRSREDIEAGDEMLRVVRGGSWDDPLLGARCAFRRGSPPKERSNNQGFRIVVRPSVTD